jgi:hypothetical protein
MEWNVEFIIKQRVKQRLAAAGFDLSEPWLQYRTHEEDARCVWIFQQPLPPQLAPNRATQTGASGA